jgi:hypothetical protein
LQTLLDGSNEILRRAKYALLRMTPPGKEKLVTTGWQQCFCILTTLENPGEMLAQEEFLGVGVNPSGNGVIVMIVVLQFVAANGKAALLP